MSKEKTRYSKEELQEFKEIILAKLEKANHDFAALRAGVSNEQGNDVWDTSPAYKIVEEGALMLSRAEAEMQAARIQKFIQNLNAALLRIENGTYGVCRKTGKLIPKERLRVVPHATTTIEAKLKEK